MTPAIMNFHYYKITPAGPQVQAFTCSQDSKRGHPNCSIGPAQMNNL